MSFYLVGVGTLSTFPAKATFISGRDLAKQAKQKFVQDNNVTIVNQIQECKKRVYEAGESDETGAAEVKRSKTLKA